LGFVEPYPTESLAPASLAPTMITLTQLLNPFAD